MPTPAPRPPLADVRPAAAPVPWRKLVLAVLGAAAVAGVLVVLLRMTGGDRRSTSRGGDRVGAFGHVLGEVRGPGIRR